MKTCQAGYFDKFVCIWPFTCNKAQNIARAEIQVVLGVLHWLPDCEWCEWRHYEVTEKLQLWLGWFLVWRPAMAEWM